MLPVWVSYMDELFDVSAKSEWKKIMKCARGCNQDLSKSISQWRRRNGSDREGR